MPHRPRASLLALTGAVVLLAPPTVRNRTREARHRVETPAADSAFALTGVTLIDGTGGPAKPRQTIVVRNGRVADVFTDGRRPIPPGTAVRSLAGKTVIPGLIDAHVHLATDPAGRDANAFAQLEAALQGGVTSVRDMAGDGIALAQLTAKCKDARDACPRIHFAALFAGPTFFDDPRARASAHGATPGELAWQRAVSATTDIPRVITEARGTGATGIKLYADLTPALADALTREAIRQGMRVWSHAALYPARPSDLVRAGVHTLSHTMLLAWDADSANMPTRYADRTPRAPYASVPATSPQLATLLTLMKQRGTILDATLWVTQQIEGAPPGAGGFAEPKRAAEWAFAVTRLAHGMGVKVGAGTDGMMARSSDGMPNIHTEMELLVSRSGFTPLEAIRAATVINAEILGRANDVGVIAVGRMADLVVLSADPTADIRNTRTVVEVYKAGVRHRAAE